MLTMPVGVGDSEAGGRTVAAGAWQPCLGGKGWRWRREALRTGVRFEPRPGRSGPKLSRAAGR